MNALQRLRISVCLLLVAASLHAAAQEGLSAGDAVEVTLTSGRALIGTVEKSGEDGVTLKLPDGGVLLLPPALIQSVQKIGAIPTTTPTPIPPAATPKPAPTQTPTATPIPLDKLPVAKDLTDLRTAYRNGVTHIRYKGQVLQLMPDGLYYSNPDAFDLEMFEMHEHLVAGAPIYAPTTTETPNVANWAALRTAREEKVPIIVLRGALAFLMPDDLYYWCEEDYHLALLADRLKIIEEKQKNVEQQLIEEAEKDQRVPNMRELLSPSAHPGSVTKPAAQKQP